MAEPARISVVIPVHNGERYIEQTIRSVLASDIGALEILVVDDGSRDRSAEVVSDVKDPRITLMQHSASGGPSRPRNVGIAHAQAPYVAFLDADDLIRPDKLSSTIDMLDRTPDAGFAFGEFEHIDADDRVLEASVLAYKLADCGIKSELISNSWHVIPRHELQRGLLQRNFIGTSGVVVRKKILARVGGFDETLVYSEDLDLWFRLAHHCSALYRDTVGHSYRLAPGSLTYAPSIRTAQDRITVLRRERRRRSTRNERRQLDRLIADSLAAIGYAHRHNRQPVPSALAFARAFVAHPNFRWARALVGSLMASDKSGSP